MTCLARIKLLALALALTWAGQELVIVRGEGLAQAQTPAASDSKAWREVLEGIRMDLDRRAAEVEGVSQALPELERKAQDCLAWADNHLTQVDILRGVAGRDPWALRTLIAHYKGLTLFLRDQAQHLELAREHLVRIKQENATLKAIRHKKSEVDYDDATVAALDEPSRKLDALKLRVDELKTRIDASLALFAGLEERVAKAGAVFREDYIENFKEHFFTGARPPLNGYGLILLRYRVGQWLQDFPRFLATALDWVRWGDLAAIGLPLWLGLWLAGSWLGRRAGAIQDRDLRLGLGLMSFGAAMFLVCMNVPFTASHSTYIVFVALAAWGAALLARRHAQPGDLEAGLTLYVLAALGHAVSVPSELLSLLWTLVLAVAAIVRFRGGARGRAGALAALGLAALAGWAPLSMIVVQAWFLAALTAAAARGLRSTLAERGGTWLSYVYPLAVTVLAVSCLAWILLFMGGPGFLDYVFAMQFSVGQARLSLDAVSAMVALFFAARLALSWLTNYLERLSQPEGKLDPALTHTLATLASYVTWTAFLLLTLSILGLPLTGLTWVASGLSVGVGFGLKDIINNFVSGLIILFGGSIKKGDVVQTGKILGEVTNVSVRNTTVRTMDNSMVIIPNSSFLRGEIINWSYQDKRIRLTIPVSVAPGTKIKKVRKLLMEEAGKNKRVLASPEPSVLLRQFGKLGLDFELYVWIEDFRDKFRVESELASAIDQALQENKVTVAFQGIKIKYKPRGSEEAQKEAAREALKKKRHEVLALVRPLRRVHMRGRWGVPAQLPPKGGEG